MQRCHAEECGGKGVASRHSMMERVIHHKKVYKALAKDELLLAWLRKQRVRR